MKYWYTGQYQTQTSIRFLWTAASPELFTKAHKMPTGNIRINVLFYPAYLNPTNGLFWLILLHFVRLSSARIMFMVLLQKVIIMWFLWHHSEEYLLLLSKSQLSLSKSLLLQNKSLQSQKKVHCSHRKSSLQSQKKFTAVTKKSSLLSQSKFTAVTK